MHEKFVSNLFIAFENGRFRWDSVDNFINGDLDYLRFIKPVTGNLMDGAAIVDIDMSTFYIEDVVDVSDILTLNFGVNYLPINFKGSTIFLFFSYVCV